MCDTDKGIIFLAKMPKILHDAQDDYHRRIIKPICDKALEKDVKEETSESPE